MSTVRDTQTTKPIIAAICTTLIATSSFKMGLAIALTSSIVLLLTGLLMNILKTRVPEGMQILFCITFAAFFTGLSDLFFQAFLPEIYMDLGVYLPIVIFTTTMVVQLPYRDSPYSMKRGLSTSIYLVIGMSLIALIRELMGKGLSSTLEYPTTYIIIGIVFAIVSSLVNKEKLV